MPKRYQHDHAVLRRLGLTFVSALGLMSIVATGGGGGSTPPPPDGEPEPTELTWDQGNWDEVNWQ